MWEEEESEVRKIERLNKRERSRNEREKLIKRRREEKNRLNER